MATPLGYCIQFRQYTCRDSVMQQCENIGLGLATSVFANLVSKLPVMQISNYHIVMGNYFACPALLKALEPNGSCCNRYGESKPNRKCFIARYGKMNKEKCGSSVVVSDVSSNITAVRWKVNEVVNAISTFTGKQPFKQVQLYCHC